MGHTGVHRKSPNDSLQEMFSQKKIQCPTFSTTPDSCSVMDIRNKEVAYVHMKLLLAAIIHIHTVMIVMCPEYPAATMI